MPTERDDTGQFVEAVALEDVLGVFDGVDGPAIVTADVVDALGCTRETAARKLEELIGQGRVAKRRTAGRPVVYWRTDREGREGDRATGEASGGGDRGGVSAGGDRPVDREVAGGEGGSVSLEAALDGLDAQQSRRDAVEACVRYLEREGSAQRSDFVDDIYPDHTAGYQSPGGWWNKIGKELLRELAEDIEAIAPPAGEGAHTWRWVGE